jgi:hypothetical protein
VFLIAECHAGLLPDDANEGPVQGVACSHWRLSHCRVVPQQLDDPPHERRN